MSSSTEIHGDSRCPPVSEILCTPQHNMTVYIRSSDTHLHELRVFRRVSQAVGERHRGTEFVLHLLRQSRKHRSTEEPYKETRAQDVGCHAIIERHL